MKRSTQDHIAYEGSLVVVLDPGTIFVLSF